MLDRCLLTAALVVALASASRDAGAQRHAHDSLQLGTVDFPVSCSPAAQAEFNRGVALLHHMTYPQARQAFGRVAELDSTCAMAHWGIAMTLFHPLWPTRPSPDDLRLGWAEVETASQLTASTERERAFVASAAEFFRNPASPDYWERIRRWERAMADVHAAFPRDPEAATFYALAHLAVAQADPSSRGNAARAADIVLRVYEANPEHPGAMHYLVHANDAPGREHDSLGIVRKYESAAPENPHALHMPTHIYTRLGDWDASIRGNLRAAEAALGHPAGEKGQWVWDEFPHAIEYVVYALLQRGADDSAATQLRRMRETQKLEPSFKTAFHLASTSARYALERRAWQDAKDLPLRDPPSLAWDRFAWPEAITWFAKGMGAVQTSDTTMARQAASHLDSLESRMRGAGEMLFAQSIGILGLELDGWMAQARGDGDSAVALLTRAAELEIATPKHAVTPGPTLPAHEMLGDLLLAQKRPADALVAYRRSLELYPGRFNSTLGAARAARSSGDQRMALEYYGDLMRLALGSSRGEALREAREFVGTKPE